MWNSTSDASEECICWSSQKAFHHWPNCSTNAISSSVSRVSSTMAPRYHLSLAPDHILRGVEKRAARTTADPSDRLSPQRSDLEVSAGPRCACDVGGPARSSAIVPRFYNGWRHYDWLRHVKCTVWSQERGWAAMPEGNAQDVANNYR